MLFKNLSILALAGYAVAQSNQTLNATLTSNPDLSNLTTFLGTNPALVEALSSAQNITILAPSNQAFNELANSSAGLALASDPGLITALLTYHVLNGTYSAAQITNTSAFIPTLLTNSSYTNVTGGQVVEAVLVGNETTFYSGLLQNATVTTAVSRHQLPNCFTALTITGCQLHRWCHSCHRYRPHSTSARHRYRLSRRLDVPLRCD